ncbi:hypothetical protein E1B28_012557 [Marasmius oreades]|uniref:Uncharacterized protein n=1 Tax=Marasmius oreades TaxID=181124 RepID=A0A9P7UNU1_9AGAR|nr:uncharacterized protein E1B28_012557 [Marasmius oreades]KAG7088578.1 hypothetical protein E1B28_012557 [Marasmius oreades]
MKECLITPLVMNPPDVVDVVKMQDFSDVQVLYTTPRLCKALEFDDPDCGKVDVEADGMLGEVEPEDGEYAVDGDTVDDAEVVMISPQEDECLPFLFSQRLPSPVSQLPRNHPYLRPRARKLIQECLV